LKNILASLLAVALLSACAGKSPLEVITKAFKAEHNLNSVAEMVVACVRDTPTEAKIADDFNYLIKLKEESADMKPDAEAVKAIIGGRSTIAEAGEKWVAVKTAINNSGLECDRRLPEKALEVEALYDELVAAIDSNQRLVAAFEWGELLAGMVGGPAGGAVVRLSGAALTN